MKILIDIFFLTINEWSKLTTNCVTASGVNMFKNKVAIPLINVGLSISLVMVHLPSGRLPWMAFFMNLVTRCLKAYIRVRSLLKRHKQG